MEFLERFADREAVRHICCKEHALWQEKLADALLMHFPDVCETKPADDKTKPLANPSTPPQA
jgi:hypothetical protein